MYLWTWKWIEGGRIIQWKQILLFLSQLENVMSAAYESL
jgi:hypothetical protein